MDGVGLHAGDLLIHLPGHYAFERDVSVPDDDVNGRNGAHLILAQDAIAINGAVCGTVDPVVVEGGGQDFDVVDDFFDTFNALDHVSGVGLERGTRDLAEQGNGAIRVDFVGEVVEHAVIRKHDEFVTDFLDDALVALLREHVDWWVVLDDGTGRGGDGENRH